MPPNPYSGPLALSFSLLPIGGIAYAVTRTPGARYSSTASLGMVITVMLLTIGVILVPAMIYCFLGHRKRFLSDRQLIHWRVDGEAWRSWRDKVYARAKRNWIGASIFVLIIPLAVTACILFGEDGGFIGVGIFLFVLMAGGLFVMAWFSTATYRRPYGEVWLGEEAAQFGTNSFFFRSYGCRFRGARLREGESDLQEIAISYSLKARHGWVDHVFVIPVPPEQVEVARKWVEEKRTQE